MTASSTIYANAISRRQTSRGLRCLLAFPVELQQMELESASDLTDAKRLQAVLHRVAEQASCDRDGAASNCGLQQGAISALGRFAKRILDLLVASITILLLSPLMLVIAIAVKLESRNWVIDRSLRGEKGALPSFATGFGR